MWTGPREREQWAKRKGAERGDCFVVLLKNSAKKFVLYGIMAVNILWKVSGNAQRATVILLWKSHFVAISPAGGLSKVRTVLWSFLQSHSKRGIRKRDDSSQVAYMLYVTKYKQTNKKRLWQNAPNGD